MPEPRQLGWLLGAKGFAEWGAGGQAVLGGLLGGPRARQGAGMAAAAAVVLTGEAWGRWKRPFVLTLGVSRAVRTQPGWALVPVALAVPPAAREPTGAAGGVIAGARQMLGGCWGCDPSAAPALVLGKLGQGWELATAAVPALALAAMAAPLPGTRRAGHPGTHSPPHTGTRSRTREDP